MTSNFCDPQHSHPHWQWSTLNECSHLRCELLSDWPHAFFTQQYYPELPETLVQYLAPTATVYRVNQVHGNVALTPSAIIAAHQAETLPQADAVITETAHQSAWVASADCTPVLIGDVATGRVSAIHSGWRGTVQRIVPETIAQFLRMGSCLFDLRLAMGPAIDGQVYQVGEDVGRQAACSIVAEPEPDVDYLQQAMKLSEPAIFRDGEVGCVRLDVRRIIELQLENLGVASEQVAIAPCCTYQQPDYFFSYRRTKAKKVQWSGIVSH
ncbi:MAG: peptidoglycan editing factor PgeF [Spirulina sp. SIO3F2]|nr:peptidoglycan editing factor PgeF [Spirulina sp. SIO3F2]